MDVLLRATSHVTVLQSTIPAALGLPPLPFANAAEGIVVKPLKALIVETATGPLRPALKKKTPRFAEDRRFHEAEKWAPRYTAPAFGNLELLMWEAYNLVTENRLHSAVSKLGHVGRGDGRRAQLLFRLLVDDVLEQLAADHKQPLSTLSAHQRDRLVDSIRGEVRALLKTHAVHETRIARA